MSRNGSVRAVHLKRNCPGNHLNARQGRPSYTISICGTSWYCRVYQLGHDVDGDDDGGHEEEEEEEEEEDEQEDEQE